MVGGPAGYPKSTATHKICEAMRIGATNRRHGGAPETKRYLLKKGFWNPPGKSKSEAIK